MRRKQLIYVYILIILAILGVIVYREGWFSKIAEQIKDTRVLNSFEECRDAGFAVAESYPSRCTDGSGKTHTQDIGNELEKNELIRIESPRPGTTITSPLTVTGEARGNWFFEASFPMRIENSQGKILARWHAQAEGDWMTEDFVKFKGTIEFAGTEGEKGKLILEKSNASGLPEHDDSLIVPIVFGHMEMTEVNVYFPNSKKETDDCAEVAEIKRQVPKTSAVARAALTELIKGPTDQETKDGYATTLPKNVGINKLEVTADGVAKVDFSRSLRNVAGSCRVIAIRSQIEKTLRQFPPVKSVEISINGVSKDILQP